MQSYPALVCDFEKARSKSRGLARAATRCSRKAVVLNGTVNIVAKTVSKHDSLRALYLLPHAADVFMCPSFRSLRNLKTPCLYTAENRCRIIFPY